MADRQGTVTMECVFHVQVQLLEQKWVFISRYLAFIIFHCHTQVINNDPSLHVHYTLKVTFRNNDAVMSANEQVAIRSIWDK